MGKKLLSMVIAAVMVFSFSIFAIAAQPQVEIKEVVTTFENGDYAVETLTVYHSSARGARATQRADKSIEYNTSQGTMWTFTISGTFTWDGKTASASNASYDYTTTGGWSFKSGSASSSGASVKGNGSFKSSSGLTKSCSPTLTCSPNGKFS